MTGYIYLIRNKVNGKTYIGQTIGNVRQRWAAHSNPKNANVIGKAINKYGKRNFELHVIETIKDENMESLLYKLNILEKSYIQAWDSLVPNGYNVLIGGKNSTRPESMRLKISKALKGQPTRKSNLGKKFTEEHKQKMSISSKWSRPVICLENQQIYLSITHASKELKIPRTSLSQSLRRTGIYQGTFTVKYVGK